MGACCWLSSVAYFKTVLSFSHFFDIYKNVLLRRLKRGLILVFTSIAIIAQDSLNF